MIAAIAAYHRPHDPYRLEQFSILLCNAWELLLKARILQLNKNHVAAIAAYERRTLSDGSPSKKLYRKRTRSGNTMTIGLLGSYDRLVNKNAEKLDKVIRQNLESVIEFRDTAVHFFHPTMDLLVEAHEVFAASVNNLVRLLRKWFSINLDSLGQSFLSIALIGQDIDAEAKGDEARLVKFFQKGKQSDSAKSAGEFSFALRVTVEAKRSSDPAAPGYRLTKDASAPALRLEEADVRERWPWTYEHVVNRCRGRYSNFCQNAQFHKAMKEVKAESDLFYRRLLDPAKPKSGGKDYYSANLFRVLDKYYTRKEGELSA